MFHLLPQTISTLLWHGSWCAGFISHIQITVPPPPKHTLTWQPPDLDFVSLCRTKSCTCSESLTNVQEGHPSRPDPPCLDGPPWPTWRNDAAVYLYVAVTSILRHLKVRTQTPPLPQFPMWEKSHRSHEKEKLIAPGQGKPNSSGSLVLF
jgi:hypothetical protein